MTADELRTLLELEPNRVRAPDVCEQAGVVPADVKFGDLEALAGKYPAVAAELRAIAASVELV
jgi:hypothetical protein